MACHYYSCGPIFVVIFSQFFMNKWKNSYFPDKHLISNFIKSRTCNCCEEHDFVNEFFYFWQYRLAHSSLELGSVSLILLSCKTISHEHVHNYTYQWTLDLNLNYVGQVSINKILTSFLIFIGQVRLQCISVPSYISDFYPSMQCQFGYIQWLGKRVKTGTTT